VRRKLSKHWKGPSSRTVITRFLRLA
jgi:hypothetical protein